MPHQEFRLHLSRFGSPLPATRPQQSVRRSRGAASRAGVTTCGWIGSGLLVAALLSGCGHTDAGQLDYSAAKFLPDFISSDVPPQSEPELVLEGDGFDD